MWNSQLVQRHLSGVEEGAERGVFLAFGRLMCRIKEFLS